MANKRSKGNKKSKKSKRSRKSRKSKRSKKSKKIVKGGTIFDMVHKPNTPYYSIISSFMDPSIKQQLRTNKTKIKELLIEDLNKFKIQSLGDRVNNEYLGILLLYGDYINPIETPFYNIIIKDNEILFSFVHGKTDMPKEGHNKYRSLLLLKENNDYTDFLKQNGCEFKNEYDTITFIHFNIDQSKLKEYKKEIIENESLRLINNKYNNNNINARYYMNEEEKNRLKNELITIFTKIINNLTFFNKVF